MTDLNLANLRTELGQKIKNTNLSTTRLNRWLNLAQLDISSEIDFSHLEYTTTFTSTANTRRYLIDTAFKKILSVVDQTNDHVLTNYTEAEIELGDPDQSDSGTPYYYSVYGLEWVLAQPASAATVDIVSTDSGDTTQTVEIDYLDGNDVQQHLSLTLNGTTTVTSTVSVTTVQRLSKSATTNGTVTVNVNDANNTVIARLGPNQLTRMYTPIHLFPIPSGANTYRVRGIRVPRSMVNDSSYPDLPLEYHELVLYGAAIRAHRDLFDYNAADLVYTKEYLPRLLRLKKDTNANYGRTSPVIRGMSNVIRPIGIIPNTGINNYGL